MDRDLILVEREKTHGSFEHNAKIWDSLCSAVGPVTNLNSRQRLALTQILTKISRMIQTPNVKDHWIDIAGYAKLGAEACE